MRNVILLSAVLFFTARSSAQNEDSVITAVRYGYTYMMDTTQPDNPYKASQVLYIGKHMSHFTSFDDIVNLKKMAVENPGYVSPKPSSGNLLADKIEAGSGIQRIPPDFASEADTYYKDSKTGILTYIGFAEGKFYAVEEPVPVIQWKIYDETRQIDRFKCQKATADFKGRHYTAWFCPELPYTNGPWKLGGLPGLILEAYDAKKEIVYTFISIGTPGKDKAALKIPAGLIPTHPKEFRKYQIAVKQRGDKSGFMKMDETRNGDGTPVKDRKNNNPVEKIP